MTSKGDDLIQARIFMISAMSDMDLLLSDLRLSPQKAVETLHRVQTEAKTMSARGIFRAAQAVLDGYDNQVPQSTIDGRLMVLYKLIVQYDDGLKEIEPHIEQASSDKTQDRNSGKSEQENYAFARSTLTELLPMAGEYTSSLQQLMSIDVGIALPTSPMISFESLMPDVTDAALRKARGQGKSISISYAVENLFMDDKQAGVVRDKLDLIVKNIVATKIGTPDQRRDLGLPKSGHIDVSAQEGPSGLNITVLCDGETFDFVPGNMAEDQLQEVGT